MMPAVGYKVDVSDGECSYIGLGLLYIDRYHHIDDPLAIPTDSHRVCKFDRHHRERI